MAIQTSKTVTEIKVVNSGSQDIIAEFNIKLTSYDDSDQGGTTISSENTFELETEGRTSSSEDWVEYSSVTQAQLETWGGEELTRWVSQATVNQVSWINSVISPPTPATVSKTLPF